VPSLHAANGNTVMKTKLVLLFALIGIAVASHAATTINAVNRFAYGANIGWMDWRGDVTSGAVIGEYICTGFIYAANVGWISLGSGTPANGIRYQNNSASDYGVNHDGLGNLRGYAYAANIGWLTFTNRDAIGTFYEGPKIDLLSGRMSGFIWSGNCGWISLSNAFAYVQTDTIRMGIDTDGDGIPDAWERERFGSLAVADASSDHDGDGVKDIGEYVADTDPNDPLSFLSITRYRVTGMGSPLDLTWSSRPTRLYHVQERTLVDSGPWSDVGLGLIAPDAGPETLRSFPDGASSQRFFRIEAVKPLP
jgi:hypothetical protein